METYQVRDGHGIYFVTFTVVEWLPVFVTADACRIVTDSLTYCHLHKFLRINAFVIMPTHLHAILFDCERDTRRLTRALADMRRYTGHRLADFCSQHMPSCYAAVMQACAGPDREREFWQPIRHPEAIYSRAFLRQKSDYLHANPCRKGLVRSAADWRFSSAAYWTSGAAAECDVPLTAIEW